MKKITVRTKTIDTNGTSYTESERIEIDDDKGLFEAWKAFILLFLTFITCVLIVRGIIPTPQIQPDNSINSTI